MLVRPSLVHFRTVTAPTARGAWAAGPPIVAAAGAVSQPAARRDSDCHNLSHLLLLHPLTRPYISLPARAAEVAVAQVIHSTRLASIQHSPGLIP